MADWRVIAENELRLMTSRFHNKRKLLIAVVLVPTATYFYIINHFLAPFFSSPEVKTMLKMFPLTLVWLLHFLLFYAFVMAAFTPLSSTLREATAEPIEVLLSTPIKPEHVLVGRFIARATIYVMGAIILFAPLDVLFYIVYESSILDLIIVNFLVAVMIAIAVWISILSISIIMSKLGKTERGRDIAKALNLILALILFIFLYGSGWFSGSISPEQASRFTRVLECLPSGWVANIISEVIIGISPEIPLYVNIGALSALCASVFFVGYHLASRFYSLEPVETVKVTVIKEGFGYSLIRKIIPGKLGELTVLHFKEFTRYMESLSRFIYGLAISVFILYMMSISMSKTPEGTDMGYWIFVYSFATVYCVPFITLLVAGDITIRGKEKLWIFRHAPKGILLFVLGKYIQSIIVQLPIVIAVPLTFHFINPTLTMKALMELALIAFILLFGCTAEIIGIFCLNPAFKEKSAKYTINTLIYIALTMFTPMFIFFGIVTSGPPPEQGLENLLTIIRLAPVGLSLLLGFTLMFLGIRNLSQIE